MNATKALELLSPIPEENWIENLLTDGKSKCCAFGHLRRLTSDDPDNYSVSNCYVNPNTVGIWDFFLDTKECLGTGLDMVNNKQSMRYPQDTPKQRVIAALTDLQTMGL